MLEPFMVATKMLEAEKKATMNLVIDRTVTLEEGLKAFIANKDNCQFGITFARSLLRNLQFRFPNSGTDRFERKVSNYLDPRLKAFHLGLLDMLDSTKNELLEKYGDDDVDNLDSNSREGREANIQLSPTSSLLKKSKI